MWHTLYRSFVVLLFSSGSFLFAGAAIAQLTAPAVTQTVADWIGKLPLATVEAAAAVVALTPDDYTGSGFQVKPTQFDPFNTNLVQAAWLPGDGCPTNAKTVVFNALGELEEQPFTDSACPTGDSNDSRIEGLLLAKTGPTANFAAGIARIVGVKGQVITELGWDIRKQSAPGVTPASFSPLGSHCGAGAPRWNIETQDGFFFLGCNSPTAPVQQASATGWIRMIWGAPLMAFNADTGVLEPVTGAIKSLTIVFDEGQDPSGGPDQFGAAILDNININGIRVGKGATNAS
jgi:hypothetical protein